MSPLAIQAQQHADLRSRATARLTGGAGQRGASLQAADALAVLHALASSPATAADALAMLHELQVHQVELDLQAEELRDARADLESMLRRQLARYASLPVACFIIDRKLVMWELNRAAAQLLGVAREEACGWPLDSFLSPGGGRRLLESIAGIAAGQSPPATVLEWMPPGQARRRVRAHLAADPSDDRFQLVLTPIEEVPIDAATKM